MSVEDAGPVQDGAADGPDSFEVACPCLNIRIVVRHDHHHHHHHAGQQDDDANSASSNVILDEAALRDGGAVRIVSLNLTTYYFA